MPGEFTFKAFQNGKIDLAKAEAVQAVIASKSNLAWKAAENQLEGKLSKAIRTFQKELTEVAAIIEAWVDYPEEGIEFASEEELKAMIQSTREKILHLLKTFEDGEMLRTGFSLCLIGAPNVGKSSLMNALCGKERSIVTHIPGTTRDLLEEEIQLAGLHFRLIDTAGIRDTEEIVEKEGILRAQKAARSADLTLCVMDGSNPTVLSLSLPPDKTILIWNKIDLEQADRPTLPFPHQVEVSAKEGWGLEELKQAIHAILLKGTLPSKEEVMITSQRHFHALDQAARSLETVLSGLEEQRSPEFLVSDIRAALKALGTIIGINISEEVLSSIFSKFCVGK